MRVRHAASRRKAYAKRDHDSESLRASWRQPIREDEPAKDADAPDESKQGKEIA